MIAKCVCAIACVCCCCWDEEGWFPSSYVDGDLYAQKNPDHRWTGGKAGEDDWETVHTSSSDDSASEDEVSPP